MRAFYTGNYRNIFAEIGKSEEEIQKKIEDTVHTFFTEVKMSAYTMKQKMVWGILRIPEIMMPERKGCLME